MARTTAMRLVELMILKEDISRVLEYLGKKENFQFQSHLNEDTTAVNSKEREMFESLQQVRSYLGISDLETYIDNASLPKEEDYEKAQKIISTIDLLREKEIAALDAKKRVDETYQEALAFSNLKLPYSEIEHLSFLALRIGKIDPSVIDNLSFTLGDRGVIIPLGEDKTRILAAASKKGRFALDAELKRFGFVPLEIPETFKGIPDDVLQGMKEKTLIAQKDADEAALERKNFAQTHQSEMYELLSSFSIGMQVSYLQNKLESTQFVYRITGWIPLSQSRTVMSELDDLTEGRIAIRQYQPDEVPSVRDGQEKVPVKLQHGKLIGSFERMVFSYGSPLYGTIDPTPVVAFFFTILFGIMFGDAGQGLVFLLIGILMNTGIIKKFPVSPKYGPVFIAIGCSSVIMGLLTGEFFANEHLLVPFGRFVTGLFGESRDRVLELMPSADSIDKLFYFFLFTLGIGFIINSIGLVINITNNFLLKRTGKALFGKTGMAGALFFWYIVFVIIRVFAFKSSIQIFDWIFIGIFLFGVSFAHPLEKIISGKRPVFPNGVGTAIIEGLVEILEIVSSYLSNSVSFLRVGAFALAHAVLGYIIFSMTELMHSGGSIGGIAGGIVVSIVGNAVVVVLEGMIVAIQVVRLQYYEFFSKFFTDTGKEFEPFKFTYTNGK